MTALAVPMLGKLLLAQAAWCRGSVSTASALQSACRGRLLVHMCCSAVPFLESV